MSEKFQDLFSKKIIIFSGKGNNGGDGFVIARHLLNGGADVEVLVLGKVQDLNGDARSNAEIALKIGVTVRETDPGNINSFDHRLRHSDIIVDAIFGTGLQRPAAGLYETAIKKINEARKYVVAVDIPSGVDSDSGQLIGPHVRADLTIALALRKRSHVLFPAAGVMGGIQSVDIGIPNSAMNSQSPSVQMTEESDVRSWFPKRPSDSHKGNYGHVLVIVGSRGKCGAAGLTALAALRSGCGLVTLATPESCQKGLEFHPLEVMTVPIPETKNGCPGIQAKQTLLEQCRGKSAVAIGPGISTDAETGQLLDELLPEINCPLVIDADGLNCLAKNQDHWPEFRSPVVLTPHPGEMSRLSGCSVQEVQENRIEAAASFAREKSVYLVLKGTGTLIAYPEGPVYINPTGNPGMATAGVGDVLTGIIAGLIAQGLEPGRAAIAGTYIHGMAGDLYAETASETTLIAGDLLRTLPEGLARIFK